MSRSLNRPLGTDTPGFRSRAPVTLALVLLVALLVSPLTGSTHAVGGTAYRIEGTVTDLEGNPLPGIHVTVFSAYQNMAVYMPQYRIEVIGGGETDAAGAYEVEPFLKANGLGPWVCFRASGYALECFDDAFHDLTEGSVVEHVPDRVPDMDGIASGIDARLEPAASITGRVTTANGTPADDVEVTVFIPGHLTWSVRTDTTGRYTIGRLKAATYFIKFHDPKSGIVEYWNDKTSQSEATPLVVATGESVTGIDEVVGPEVKSVAAPLISGTAQVGQALTASGDAWTPEGTTVTYRWVVGSDTVASDDPTGATYLPTTADVGQTIRVHATGTYPGRADGSAWSTPTATVAAAPTTTALAAIKYVVRPRVKGVPEVGRVLRVTRGVWQPTAVTLRYHWYAGGKAIRDATHRRFTLTPGYVGKRLTVKVKAGAPGHPKAIVWTKPTPRIKP